MPLLKSCASSGPIVWERAKLLRGTRGKKSSFEANSTGIPLEFSIRKCFSFVFMSTTLLDSKSFPISVSRTVPRINFRSREEFTTLLNSNSGVMSARRLTVGECLEGFNEGRPLTFMIRSSHEKAMRGKNVSVEIFNKSHNIFLGMD